MSQSKFQRYLYTMIRIQIILHQYVFHCPSLIKIILFILYQLQQLTFLKFDNQDSNIIIILKYFLRPDMIFDFKGYGFLIPFLFICVFDIIILQFLTIRHIIHPPQGKTPDLQLDSKYLLLQFFIYLTSLLSQISLMYLYIPIQAEGMHSISRNLQYKNYGNVVLGIIGVILFDLTNLMKKILCTASLNLQIKGFEQIELCKTHLLQYIILRVQLIVTISVEVDNAALQTVLIMIHSLSELYNQIYNQVYIDQIYASILIYSQSFTLIFCILNFTNNLEISYLIFPLLSYTIQQVNNSIIQNCLQNIQKSKDEQRIRYFLIAYINKQVHFESSKFKIIEAILLHQHLLKCDQPECDCKQIIRTDEINKICLLSDNLMKRFFFTKLNHWNSLLSKSNEANYIQYLAACIQFDFSTTAFQECNKVLHHEQSINSIGFMSNRESNNRQDSLSKGSSIVSKKHTKKLIKLRSRINTISSFSQEKVKLLLDVVRLNLNQNFYSKQNKTQEDMTIGIKLFMESEIKNENLKLKIIKAIKCKLQFYQQLQTNGKMIGNNLFSKSKSLSNRLQKLEIALLKQYEQFPSQKLQSINCFVQAELLNNYLKAFKIQNLTTISDEKLQNMRKILKVNLFGKNVVYLIVQLSDNLQNMKILKHSNQSHRFFNYRSHEFQKHQFIDFLLPNAIKDQHSLLIQQFLLTGDSKYFRNMELNFILPQEGLIKPINFYFDLNTAYTEDLSFVSFFEENNNMNGYIIVNVNEVIGDVSHKLLELQGWKPSEIKNNYLSIIPTYQVPIISVLPRFHDYIEFKQDYQKIYDAHMQFVQKQSLNSQTILGQKAIKDIWTESTVAYSATISIFQRDIYGFKYYIIEVEDLKSQGWKSYVSSNKTENDDMKMQTDIESESQANFPQELNLCIQNQSLAEHFSQIDDQQRNQFQNQNQSFQQQSVDYGASFFDRSKLKDENLLNQSSVVRSATALMNKQQRFFEAKKEVLSYEKSDSKSRSYSQIQNVNQFYEVDLDKIDKEMRENIKMQLQLDNQEQEQQIDDQASQVSSLIGVRRSIFYKKYEVIQKVISKDKKPKELLLYNSLIALYFLITVINCIVVLVNTEKDMNRFLQEIDMILLHSSFMTPFDTFMMFRFQLVNYQSELRFRLISQKEYDYIYEWDMSQMGFGYTEMKENFNFQLSNPYMQEFFVDETNDVYFQGASQNDIYLSTISLRESLFQLMQYQYAYNAARINGQSVTNTPFQTYLSANYLNFHDRLQKTTERIMEYTQNRKAQVQEKWLVVWIPFLSISIILIALAYKIYLNYIIIYEDYLDLFKYANKIWIDKEMDRYKVLLSILNADSETMFKYQYNLEAKEKFMMTENYNNEGKGQRGKEQAKRSQLKGQQKMNKFFSFLLFSIIMLTYFIITLQIEVDTNDYLNQYGETAYVYRLFGDTNFRVSEVYAFRQILYYWFIFPYYTDNDRVRMLTRLNYGVSMLEEFNLQFQQFHTKNYLTDQTLLDLLDRLAEGNVCLTLSEEQQQNFKYFCDRAFDGTLTQSMVNAINYITTFMTTEVSINNFTTVLSYYKYEAEGAYVLVNVIKKVVSALKNGLKSGTESHMSGIIDVSIAYICITVSAVLLQFTIIWTFFEIEYFLVKRFVLLLPSAVLLLDDNLERRIRQIQSNV